MQYQLCYNLGIFTDKNVMNRPVSHREFRPSFPSTLSRLLPPPAEIPQSREPRSRRSNNRARGAEPVVKCPRFQQQVRELFRQDRSYYSDGFQSSLGIVSSIFCTKRVLFLVGQQCLASDKCYHVSSSLRGSLDKSIVYLKKFINDFIVFSQIPTANHKIHANQRSCAPNFNSSRDIIVDFRKLRVQIQKTLRRYLVIDIIDIHAKKLPDWQAD